MDEPPAPQNNKPNLPSLHTKSWLIFLFIATPSYIFFSWALLTIGRQIIHINDSHVVMARCILVIFYLFLAVSTYTASRSRRISTPAMEKNSASQWEIELAKVRRENPLFTDEIDQLHKSIQGMLKNLDRQRQALIESRQKMQELVRTTLNTQETERRIVSRELHDQAGQLLVSLRFTVQTLLADLMPDSDTRTESALELDTLRTRLSTMLVQIDKTLETVRALSHKMRPALLDVGDINLAMQEYCSEFQKGKKITIGYRGSTLPQVPEEIAISLLRFLQEALTNVLKHSNASAVKVKLENKSGWIKMSVADNGRGERAGTNRKGIGILGLRERFRLLDGIVETYSSEHGFTITVRVPLKSPAH